MIRRITIVLALLCSVAVADEVTVKVVSKTYPVVPPKKRRSGGR